MGKRFIMDIDKVRAETFRLGLKAPEDYLKTLRKNPEAVAQVVNGVGSQESWTYHLSPDTIYGLNINPSSHIHDWEYKFPEYFETWAEGMAKKAEADQRFYTNMLIQINDGVWILRPPRKGRAWLYYETVHNFGTVSFWAGKQMPVDWREHREIFEK